MTTEAAAPTTTQEPAAIDPRAILRAVIAAANAPLHAERAELEPKLADARALLADLLADPEIVAAQATVNALAARDEEVQRQLQATEDALAALDAPAVNAPTAQQGPATTAHTDGKPDNFPMRFFQTFSAKYRTKITVTQKELTAFCKRAGIDQSDRSAENLLRAYNALVQERAA